MLNLIIYIIFLSLSGITIFFILFNYLIYKSFHLPHIPSEKTPADFGINAVEHFAETGHDKKIELWDLNPDSNKPVILCVHGWANTASDLLQLGIKLSENWRVFLLNTRNHGKSDDEKYPSILKYSEDIINSMNYIQDELKLSDKFILCGHSMGGAAVLLSASRDSRVKAVISIAAFSDMEKMIRQGFEKQKFPESLITSMVKYVEFRIGNKLKHLSPTCSITKFSGSVFLVHGTRDEVVDFTDLNHLFKAAKNDKTVKFVMKGHTHNSLLISEELPAEINNFLKKYFKV
jgi:dipeptidyl aminopeptidase/acylaminoacyl peptidase